MDLRPVFCGLCFGIYPILANRSKLTSGAMFFVLGAVGIFFASFPFLQNGVASLKAADTRQILFMAASACASATGVLVMFRYLADTPTEKAGGLVIVMVVMQVITTWAISSAFAGKVPSGNQMLGVMFAVAAIYFIQR